MLVLYLTAGLHVGAAAVGVLLSGEAVGGVLGAALTRRLARRLGLGRALLIGSVTISAPLLAVPVVTGLSPAPAVCVFLALLGSGFGRAVQNVAIGAVFALSVPDALRSRVRGAFQTVSFGCRAAGALLGGMLGAAVGLRPALCVGVAGGLLVVLWLLPSPLLGLRMPEA
jgi:predicted MFS family arabinose efflux permease